jgi:hypothetical protein
MEPEEMDLVELVENITVEPSWRIEKEGKEIPATLNAGERGMVIHRSEGTPTLFDVEFLDPATSEPCVLATLRAEQVRVVERDTLGSE